MVERVAGNLPFRFPDAVLRHKNRQSLAILTARMQGGAGIEARPAESGPGWHGMERLVGERIHIVGG